MRHRLLLPIILLTTTVGLLSIDVGNAGQIATRAELDTYLGAGAVSEDFEAFSIDPGVMLDIQPSGLPLDSAGVLAGQGPNLVVPGVEFSGYSSEALITWAGASQYFGNASKGLLGEEFTLTVDFTQPTEAFGLDLLDTLSPTTPDNAYIQVYAENDTDVIAEFPFTIQLPGSSPIFFGYSDVNGIGKAVFSSDASSYSPFVDDLTFGAPSLIPEPSSVAMLLGGAVGLLVFGRRRKRKPALGTDCRSPQLR